LKPTLLNNESNPFNFQSKNSIKFHKFSDAAKKYGRSIGGILAYGKNERKDLEATINSDNIPRTNGVVKIDVSSNYNLTEEQVKDLLEVGFSSADIYEILASNTPLTNAYGQKGKKPTAAAICRAA
jgi:hypothetical protein